MSVAYAILLYVASAVFFGGVFFRVLKYWRTPTPLKIPTMPAPVTQAGVVMRMAREVVLFESLFKSSMWTWIFGWMFHVSLLLAFFRHLRYAISPDNILWPLISLELVQAAGKYAGLFMLIGLLGLLARRIFVERVRYISGPSDYLMLILILTIAGTGLSITFLDPTDIVSLKIFVLGLFRFDLQPLPSSLLLQTHLATVALLMIVFPISKLLHAPGIFFSPTRNQVDDAREKRHLVPWAAKLDATRGHKIEIKG